MAATLPRGSLYCSLRCDDRLSPGLRRICEPLQNPCQQGQISRRVDIAMADNIVTSLLSNAEEIIKNLIDHWETGATLFSPPDTSNDRQDKNQGLRSMKFAMEVAYSNTRKYDLYSIFFLNPQDFWRIWVQSRCYSTRRSKTLSIGPRADQQISIWITELTFLSLSKTVAFGSVQH